MANISKIKLPNSTIYNIKDNTEERSDHRHYRTDLLPLESKTYTGVIGTANNWAGATFFFGSIKPTTWYAIWKIKFNIHIYVPGKDTFHQTSEVMMTGDQNALRAYSSMNSVVNHLVYYGVLYRLKSAGFTNGYGHSVGCRFYSSNYPIDTNYKRTIEVDILETENCTFNFYDSCLPYANIPGTGSTNYDSYTEINWVSNGLQEVGDSDTIDDKAIYFGGKTDASKGIWAGSLFMEDGNGTYQNICAASDGTITNSNRTVATTKIANTSGFKIGGKVYYSNTNYGANSNISGWGVVYTTVSLFDTRYAFNTTLTANSLTPYKPLYLVGTVSNGLFYLDSIWWTQTPTATGKVYVLVGGVYDSTTSNCRMGLYQHNPWYYYNGTRLVSYVGDAQTVNGHTVAANVPSDAKFTDTVPTATKGVTTGISIAAHGTGTVIGVQSSTTTASKVTVGSHSTDYGVKSAGSASTWTFEEKTIPNVTAAGSGSASLTFAMDTTDTKKLKITFSHTHTAPTIGTAIKVQSKSGGANGTAPTLGSKVPTVSASDVTVPIKNASASTFVTGTTHTITDNGHTHSI